VPPVVIPIPTPWNPWTPWGNAGYAD
jgi:hypothetical protein